jgi:hypothetical protein
VNAQALADGIAYSHARIQRGVRILKDHLHLAAHLAHLRSGESGQLPAFEGDSAAGRLDQPNEAASQAGLAAARLADQSDRLSLLHIEAHAVNRPDVLSRAPQQPGRHRKIFLQITNFEQRHLTQP